MLNFTNYPYSFQRRWSVDQLKFTFSQSAGPFFRAALPYKGIEYYLNYFEICSKLVVQKDAKVVAQFKLLFFLLVYWALLVAAHALLPLSPLVRIILLDFIFILRLNHQFYLLHLGAIGYTIYLHWAMYVKSSTKINLIAENCLVGKADKLPAEVKFVRFEGAAKQAALRRLVLVITNAVQGCFFAWELLLIVGVMIFVFELLSNFHLLADLSIFAPLLLLPIFLFHLLLFFLLWFSAGYIFVFMATFGFVSLLYTLTFFQQNYIQLKRALKLVNRHHFNFCSCLYLRKTLQQNLHFFLTLFIGDAFFGPLFTVYLACNVPISSHFIIQLALNKVFGIVRLMMIGQAMEAFLGGLVCHFGLAFISSFAHKGGKLLLSFNAKGSIQNRKLPVNIKFHLFAHIQRLAVQKKYGMTYCGKLF